MRAFPLLVAAPVVALTVGLGVWQLGRHAERNAPREAAARVAGLPTLDTLAGTPDPTWRAVALRGRREGLPQLESGLVQGDAMGYRRYDRFVTDAGAVLLVDGGWVPHEGLAAALAAPLPDELRGQVRPLAGDATQAPLAERDGAVIWAPGTSAAMARRVGAAWGVVDERLHPLPRIPDEDPTSLHYALQWFGIAALAAGFAGVAARRPAAPPPRR